MVWNLALKSPRELNELIGGEKEHLIIFIIYLFIFVLFCEPHFGKILTALFCSFFYYFLVPCLFFLCNFRKGASRMLLLLMMDLLLTNTHPRILRILFVCFLNMKWCKEMYLTVLFFFKDKVNELSLNSSLFIFIFFVFPFFSITENQ